VHGARQLDFTRILAKAQPIRRCCFDDRKVGTIADALMSATAAPVFGPAIRVRIYETVDGNGA
jgi:hypothetical protein